MAKGNRNPRSQTNGYFQRIAVDSRLTCMHIGLLMALYYYGESIKIKFDENFRASRRKLMSFSRIRSRATYHKCIKELVCYKYISYEPSWHPQHGSSFQFLVKEKGGSDEQA
ncbi:hypothetical protein [Sphingobacterium corticis]|uniref:hypothetical protein n=1 Tax=Sphingobacterium corticis TaxID=1812823 RepID=UPI0036D33946